MPNRHQRRNEERLKKKLEREDPYMAFAFDARTLHAFGPVISTDIGITDSHRKMLSDQGLAIPPPVRCRLLIDTGADGTMLKHEFAERAGLKLLATDVPVHGVGIDTTGRTYLGRIIFACDSRLIPNSKHTMWVDTQVTSGALHDSKIIDGLLGRDVLQYFDMRYNGRTGLVTLKYLKG